MRIASICPHCHRIVPANETCGCRPKRTMTAAERAARYPYTKAHSRADYKRNRAKRYALAGGRCEQCGVIVERGHWECHHVRPVREFTDLAEANALENLRIMCRPCHNRIKRR